MHKRLSLEMGGKNAQIVMNDADLELALDGVLWGAFGTTRVREVDGELELATERHPTDEEKPGRVGDQVVR